MSAPRPKYGQGVKEMEEGYRDFLAEESLLGDKFLALVLQRISPVGNASCSPEVFVEAISKLHPISAKSKSLDVDLRNLF